MKGAVRDVRKLFRLLDLPVDSHAEQGEPEHTDHGFPVFVPRGFVSRMEQGDPNDPLLLQVLPTAAESDDVPGFNPDPVGDRATALAPDLLKKYSGRALLLTTGACAVHCRYCFRRHFPYSAHPQPADIWQLSLDAIAADPSIHEVILSGGDPLTLVDPLLTQLVRRLEEIPHLRRLRVHTRLPIVIPERVTNELLAWLTGSRLATIMVVHANHAQEIDAHVAAALGRLVDAGVPVLNQAVLLAGVNDSLNAQLALCERLIDLRVMPYYLHLLDRVAGAAHFEVSTERGREIIVGLRAQLPGYAVPRLVREVPGALGKEAV